MFLILTVVDVICSSFVHMGTIVLWIKNLSLHMLSGGATFCACIITVNKKLGRVNMWNSNCCQDLKHDLSRNKIHQKSRQLNIFDISAIFVKTNLSKFC